MVEDVPYRVITAGLDSLEKGANRNTGGTVRSVEFPSTTIPKISTDRIEVYQEGKCSTVDYNSGRAVSQQRFFACEPLVPTKQKHSAVRKATQVADAAE